MTPLNEDSRVLMDSANEGEQVRIGIHNRYYIALKKILEARTWARRMKRERDEWKERYHKRFYDIETWMEKAEQMQADNDRLRKETIELHGIWGKRDREIIDLRRRVKFLEGLIKSVEWEAFYEACPWCKWRKSHSPTCPAFDQEEALK